MSHHEMKHLKDTQPSSPCNEKGIRKIVVPASALLPCRDGNGWRLFRSAIGFTRSCPKSVCSSR